MLLDKSATLNVRHETFRAKNSCHGLQSWHVLWRGNDFVKRNVSFSYLLQDRVVTNKVSALCLQFIMELFPSKNADSGLFSSARRQDAGASDVLITLCRVNIQLNNNFEALFELPLHRDFFGLRENLHWIMLLLLDIEDTAASGFCFCR